MARKTTEETFYLTKAELEQLSNPDIEIQLDGLVGKTWEDAMRYMNNNGGLHMQNVIDDKKQTVGYKVFTNYSPGRKIKGVPDEVAEVFNNPPGFGDTDSLLKWMKESYRTMYRSMLSETKQ